MSRSRFRFAIIMLAGALVFGAQVFGAPARAALPQSNDDSTIVSDIQAKLFDDSVLKTRDIHVASQDGVVMLSGAVNTDLEKAAVDRIVSHESGVKKAVDGLTVSGSSATPAAGAGGSREAPHYGSWQRFTPKPQPREAPRYGSWHRFTPKPAPSERNSGSGASPAPMNNRYVEPPPVEGRRHRSLLRRMFGL